MGLSYTPGPVILSVMWGRLLPHWKHQHRTCDICDVCAASLFLIAGSGHVLIQEASGDYGKPAGMTDNGLTVLRGKLSDSSNKHLYIYGCVCSEYLPLYFLLKVLHGWKGIMTSAYNRAYD